MKNFIFCILALLASLTFVACRETLFIDEEPYYGYHDFAIKLCDENGIDILNENMDNNICDTRITIVCEGESINVSNPRHPEWDPMWPALDGSKPVLESHIFIVNPEYYQEYKPMWTNIRTITRDDLKDQTMDLELLIGPKRVPVKIIRSRVIYVNGEIVFESKIPSDLYFKIVLSDKDLSDIHDWTARQQGN